VSHVAGVRVFFVRGEGHVLDEVVVPVLLEGQVCLLSSGHLPLVLGQLDADIWRVEAGHVTDQSVVLDVSRSPTVHLNSWCSYRETEREKKRSRVYR